MQSAIQCNNNNGSMRLYYDNMHTVTMMLSRFLVVFGHELKHRMNENVELMMGLD